MIILRTNGSLIGEFESVEAAVKFRADLSRAYLSEANLSRANLSWANLSWANLSEANFSEANLFGADLSRANLSWANLSGANLSRANLLGASLSRAGFDEKTLFPPISILPQGDIIGWKKLSRGVICALKIPSEARRVNSTTRKCRAEWARVTMLYSDSIPDLSHGMCGTFDSKLIYKVGEIVKPDSFDPDFRVDCSHGIHFFITRQEAETYD